MSRTHLATRHLHAPPVPMTAIPGWQRSRRRAGAIGTLTIGTLTIGTLILDMAVLATRKMIATLRTTTGDGTTTGAAATTTRESADTMRM